MCKKTRTCGNAFDVAALGVLGCVQWLVGGYPIPGDLKKKMQNDINIAVERGLGVSCRGWIARAPGPGLRRVILHVKLDFTKATCSRVRDRRDRKTRRRHGTSVRDFSALPIRASNEPSSSPVSSRIVTQRYSILSRSTHHAVVHYRIMYRPNWLGALLSRRKQSSSLHLRGTRASANIICPSTISIRATCPAAYNSRRPQTRNRSERRKELLTTHEVITGQVSPPLPRYLKH